MPMRIVIDCQLSAIIFRPSRAPLTFMLDSFFLRGDATSALLDGSHDPGLVLLSILIAILGATAAMQIAGLARRARTRTVRQVALLTGSFSLGCAIWSMHFIGMLAFDLCVTVRYDTQLTLLSMLPALVASWSTLGLLSRDTPGMRQVVVGGIVLGAGIGTMHYVGMAAMQLTPVLRYDPAGFLASLLVAVGLSITALWVRFHLRARRKFGPRRAIVISGIILGTAIAAMHYTAMAAARFVGSAEDSGLIEGNTYLALSIALLTLTASVFVLAGNVLLRYRQLYEQMQENEARQRAIVDTAVDGIITIDQAGTIRAVNRATERLFGWTAAEIIGRNINSLMPEPYHSAHDGYLAHYMRTGEARIIGTGRTVSARRKDGSVFPIRLAVGRTEALDPPLFVGFISDISEHAAMARELQIRETQYRTLISNIPGVAFRSRADDNWSKIFISEQVFALTGWEAEVFLSDTVRYVDLIHPEDLGRVRASINDALCKHESYALEYRIRRRNGVERWVSERASGVYDGDGTPCWIDGVMLDITDVKARAAEHEGVVSAIRRALAVIEFDLDGTILDANDNFLILTGYARDTLIGRHHSILCYPEEVASDQYRTFWAALNAGEFRSGEFCRLSRDGKEVWIQASYNPIFDADGKPWKIVKLASDLGLRKLMERELVDARDRAEQAASAKGMFLANMSHEIRTPMNAVIGFTELLLDSELDTAQRRHLQIIRQSSRSLLGLLNDILDTAKLERGAIDLEVQDFSLQALCEQVISTFTLQAESKHLNLSLHYARECPREFRGDALRIRQVLTNLLGNAIKFTPQGSVTLTVTHIGSVVSMEVRDTGIGIAPDRLDSIFAPFTQADASMARRFGGTGLGTTISRQLVELMGGTISVSSTLDVGSCFTIRLPLPAADVRKPAAAPATTSAPGELPPLRILVADDVPLNLELIKLTLNRRGHQVTTADGGEAVVAAYRKGDYDIVLMDVQMPDIDGLEATRRLHQLSALQNRPPPIVIALTASVLHEDQRAAREAGMSGFASKPVDLPALEQEIARVLGLDDIPASPGRQDDCDLDWRGALERWGEPARLLEALRRFIQTYRSLPLQLSANPEADHPGMAHRLKGLAANLGLNAIVPLAVHLESGNDVDEDWSRAFNEAIDAIAQTYAQKMVEHASAPTLATTQALPASTLIELLARLDRSLTHGSIDDQALDTLTATLPLAALSELVAAIDQFDFDQARQAISALRQQYATTANTP